MRTNCTERFGQQETKAFFVQNNTVFVGHILRKKKKKTLAICNQVTALKKAGNKPKSKDLKSQLHIISSTSIRYLS